MVEEKKDSDPKFRQLTELKQTAAEEYQQAMLHRVEEFSQKRDSVFNRAFENILMTSVDLFLNVKEKIDGMIGDDMKDKLQDAFQKMLLAF